MLVWLLNGLDLCCVLPYKFTGAATEKPNKIKGPADITKEWIKYSFTYTEQIQVVMNI